jgi:chemotaxis protein methyltransferase CheR
MTTLTPPQFERIAAIARSRWGLHLTTVKQPLVANRVDSFLRGSDFENISALIAHLENGATETELLEFFDVLSTNVTSFFRERWHFDYLEKEFYGPLARGELPELEGRVRIWSAACSAGQEPYSLAIHALETLPKADAYDIKILATDLSNSALGEARRGVYASDKLAGLSPQLIERHFVRGTGVNRDLYSVAPHVRRLVSIGQLNLMEPWPFKRRFDVIFCRNVMIYFDAETRLTLLRKFHGVLRPSGILAIGSSETLHGLDVPFKAMKASVYVKEEGSVGR